jgi:hypothetical protein
MMAWSPVFVSRVRSPLATGWAHWTGFALMELAVGSLKELAREVEHS